MLVKYLMLTTINFRHHHQLSQLSLCSCPLITDGGMQVITGKYNSCRFLKRKKHLKSACHDGNCLL